MFRWLASWFSAQSHNSNYVLGQAIFTPFVISCENMSEKSLKKQKKKRVLTSFWVHKSPKIWSKHTTAMLPFLILKLYQISTKYLVVSF